MKKHDFVIVGGGIVGLATGMTLVKKFPRASVLVLEKEAELASHQTKNNSGVIHSGIYYKPGSFKAEFSRRGRKSMVDFCREHEIEHEVCGKIIVALTPEELPRLEALYERGIQNDLEVNRLTSKQALDIEPNVTCLAALHVPATGIVNYGAVSEKYAELIRKGGGEIVTGARVRQIVKNSRGSFICQTSSGEYEAGFLINCAGLFSDRVAKLAGLKPQARIVPFRGEYYELSPKKRGLVKGLIYPVPNPDFPFLGVHFTRMINGEVHAGPNAVLALRREGYSWSQINLRDVSELFTNTGFLKFAAKNFGEGMKEMVRSLSKDVFVKNLQRLIPTLKSEDVVPSNAGVRAQAMGFDGKLIDDFLIQKDKSAVHVLNAPSPAATCSIEIGRAIVEHVTHVRGEAS